MITTLAVLLFLPVMLGTALGYCMVRLFVWAWPSLWQILRPGGVERWRGERDHILTHAPGHARWRANYYAFEGLRHWL
jgi:hypothetical protein